MDATTKSLCAMLQGGDPELKAAAARVFAELQPQEAEVLSALAAVVRSAVGPVALYALRALSASPTPEAIAYLVPALAGPPELRPGAIEAVARFGARAIPYLRDAFLSSELPLRKAVATVLVRIGGRTAHDLLLRGLRDGNLELSKHLCFELDQAIQQMADDEKAAFADLVLAYLADKRTQGTEAAIVSGLILLGVLKAPKGRATLLRLARPRQAPEVRRRALLALRGIAASLTPADLAALVDYVEEEDLPNVVLPAIELLRPVELPPAVSGRVIPLAASPHQAVRDFAVYEMGTLDTPEAAKTLVEQLDAPQPGVREPAISSLQRNPAAVPLLLKRARTEKDVSRLWTLARILERHAAAIPAREATAALRLLLECLEAGDRRAEPLAYLLRRAAPVQLDAALLKQAAALKVKERFAEADRMLTTLLRGGAAPVAALYEGAITALKLSPRSLTRHERAADPCLERVDSLVGDASFPLVPRLCSDPAVKPEDLFYIGFHFAEQLGDRRELGGALLRQVVTQAPRSALAASARNKLRLEAFPVEELPPSKSSAATKPKSPKRASARPPAERKGSKKRP